MFRVVSQPIIRSTHNCFYSIWYLLNCCSYLPLLWKSWNWFERGVGIVLICYDASQVHSDIYPTRCNVTQLICFWKLLNMFRKHQNRSVQLPHHTQTSSNSSTIAGGSSNGLKSARYCKNICMCS